MPRSSEGQRSWAALPALAVALLAVVLLSPAPAEAHPQHLVEPIEVRDFGYAPSPVTIRQGSSVQWRWRNSIPHSVTSAPGSVAEFDSGMHADGDRSFVLRFDEPGTVRYFSNSGSARIEGTIEVIPLPGKAPRIFNLRVRGGDRLNARFKLNKGVYLVGRVQQRRAGQWRTRAAISENGPRDLTRLRLPTRKLDRGRYRLKLTAYDRYRREDTARTRFRVR